MKPWERFTDLSTGKERGLRIREDQGHFWWELRPCSFYDLFQKARIAYQAIQFYPRYAIENGIRFGNNKTYFIETSDPFVAATLNSPIAWYFSWRHFLHLKDEALSNDQVKINVFPIPKPSDERRESTNQAMVTLRDKTVVVSAAAIAVNDWLRFEFGLEKSNR